VTRTNLDLHPQPKIFCLLVIENEKGEYVMHRRAAHQFMGQNTFPVGALFFDETLDELVTRQLYEKIGSHVKMTHRGMASLRLGEKGYTLSHTYVHLLYGKIDSQTELQAKDSRFTPQWVNPSETSEVLLPDILDIINQIKLAKSYFFLDLYLTR
jgi:ADP-ribose pyrophosphatase YjhB (NUDIX family)